MKICGAKLDQVKVIISPRDRVAERPNASEQSRAERF
jgi:hypothetical protein